MTVTLDLPKPLERQLTAEAARQGVALSELAVKLLEESMKPKSGPKTGSEILAYWEKEGLLGGDLFPPGDSTEVARYLRRKAEKRSRE